MKKHTSHYTCPEIIEKDGNKSKHCCCTGHKCKKVFHGEDSHLLGVSCDLCKKEKDIEENKPIVDQKVKDYLDRAKRIVEIFPDRKVPLQYVVNATIEVAKMIQAQELWDKVDRQYPISDMEDHG